MKKVLSILLAAAMLLALAACSSPAKTETAAPAAEETAAEPAAAETAEETSEAEEAPATEEAKTSLDIVFIPKGVADYWSIVQAGFENAATELGMTPRVVYPSKEEAGVQIETVMDVINSKPDAIVLAPVSGDALVSACQEIQKAGIPLIIADTAIPTEDYLQSFMTDNVAAGAMAADELAALMGEEGQVYIFSDSPAKASVADRVTGFEARMKEAYPNIEVLGTLYSEADINLCTTQCVDVITANPDIKGIFAVDENRAAGVGTALIQLGREDIFVGGFDANKNTVSLMEDGVINFLTVQQPYQIGYMAYKAAADAANGVELEHGMVDTGCTIVPRDKLDDEDMQAILFPLEHLN